LAIGCIYIPELIIIFHLIVKQDVSIIETMKKKILIISLAVFSTFICQVVLASDADLAGVSPSGAKTLNNKDWQQTIDAIRNDTSLCLIRMKSSVPNILF